jgi:hypothetical protein
MPPENAPGKKYPGVEIQRLHESSPETTIETMRII